MLRRLYVLSELSLSAKISARWHYDVCCSVHRMHVGMLFFVCVGSLAVLLDDAGRAKKHEHDAFLSCGYWQPFAMALPGAYINMFGICFHALVGSLV